MKRQALRRALIAEGLIPKPKTAALDVGEITEGLNEIDSFLEAKKKMIDGFEDLMGNGPDRTHGNVDVLSRRLLEVSQRIRYSDYPSEIYEGVSAVTTDDRDDEFQTRVFINPKKADCSCPDPKPCNHIKQVALNALNECDDEYYGLKEALFKIRDAVFDLHPIDR